MHNTEKLSKEIDEMLEEFGPIEEDPRLKNISDEEFEASIKKAEEVLHKEFEDMEYRRLKAELNARISYTLDI